MQKKIILKYPLKIKTDKGNDAEVKELTLRRLVSGDLKSLPADFFSLMQEEEKKAINPTMLLPLIAKMAGIEEYEAEMLDVEDLMSIIEEVTAIMGKQLSPKAKGI